MVFRAILCCAALVFGLLAALSATAQSAGAPLNLMSFMHGQTKAAPAKTVAAKTANAAKHRRTAVRAAARHDRNIDTTPASTAEPPELPAAAAAAYASHSTDDVQVVSGDEVNAIDLAMNSSTAETNGASSRKDDDIRDLVKWADAAQSRAVQGSPMSTAAPSNGTTGSGTARDDSWIGRFWAAIGDGYLALLDMLKRLFF